MAKKEKNKKENSKNKKSFAKDFKAELKKVIWPTPKQLVNNTLAVIVIVLITAAIVFVLDLTFETLNTKGVDKIKEIVSTTSEESNTTSDESSTTEESTDNTQTEGETTEGTENTENAETTENGESQANTESNE